MRILILGLVLSLGVASPVRGGEEKAPNLAWQDLEGKTFVLEKVWEQSPVIVTFWATWCRPCLKEIPELKKMVEKYKDAVRVVAVNGDGPTTASRVRPYVQSQKLPFTILLDPDSEIKRRFQVEVFPTTFLIGTDGIIRHRNVGYRRGEEALLEEKLKQLIGWDEAAKS